MEKIDLNRAINSFVDPKIKNEYIGIYNSVHFVTCKNCGQEVKWLDSDYTGGSVDDDKFSNVLDKLKWHRENDKICIRERKLKKLGI